MEKYRFIYSLTCAIIGVAITVSQIKAAAVGVPIAPVRKEKLILLSGNEGNFYERN